MIKTQKNLNKTSSKSEEHINFLAKFKDELANQYTRDAENLKEELVKTLEKKQNITGEEINSLFELSFGQNSKGKIKDTEIETEHVLSFIEDILGWDDHKKEQILDLIKDVYRS